MREITVAFNDAMRYRLTFARKWFRVLCFPEFRLLIASAAGAVAKMRVPDKLLKYAFCISF